MKTTTIKMSQVKGGSAFDGVQWKDATIEQQSQVFAALAKITKSVKQPA